MAKTKKKHKKSNLEEESTLKAFFIEALKDMFGAEKHLVKHLPGLANSATSDKLKKAMENHLTETEQQVSRLEQVFESIEEKAAAKKCDAMEVLIKEAEEVVKTTQAGSLTRDVALINSVQKVEHYEIASYGTLRTLAGVLKFKEARKLLKETLKEEKKADALLTDIAKSFVNKKAKKERK